MNGLEGFRARIDALDDRIVTLLAERLAICAEVGHHKSTHGLPVMQPDRVTEVKQRNAARGEAAGLRPDFVRRLYGLIIDEACALENDILDGGDAVGSDPGPPLIATLGPTGSNHELIADRYASRVSGTVRLFPGFDAALAAVEKDAADTILICAAHPDCARIVGEGQFRLGLAPVECFIAESRPLGILTRKGVNSPQSIALHPATESYADISGWDRVIHVPSTVEAADGLARGDWDSALTALHHAERTGADITLQLGAPKDAWLVLRRPDPSFTGSRQQQA